MRTFGWFLMLFAISCGSPSKQNSVVNAPIETETDSATQLVVSRFEKQTVVDSVTKLDAVISLVPQGWEFRTLTKWVTSDYIVPFKYALVTRDTADTVNHIEIFPTLSFFTSSERTVPDTIGNGSIHELRYSVSVPNTATDAIRDFLIPIFRPNLHDFRVKELMPLSSIEDIGEDGQPMHKETGLVRVQYTIEDATVEEIFFATLAKTFIPIDRYDTQCRWHIENAMSCRAHTGYMDDQLKNFQTLVSNLRYGFLWSLKYDDARRRIGEAKQDRLDPNALQRIIAQSKTTDDRAADVFQFHQRHIWRFAKVYNRYHNLLQTYVDDTGDYIQLPKGFTVAWRNDKNVFVLSDSSSFRPNNVDPTAAWTELRRNESLQEEFPEVSAAIMFEGFYDDAVID